MSTITEYEERLRKAAHTIHALEKLEHVQRPSRKHICTMQLIYAEILKLLDGIQVDIEDENGLFFERHRDYDGRGEPTEEYKRESELMGTRETLGLIVGGMRSTLRSLDMHEDGVCIPSFRWRRRDYEWSDQAVPWHWYLHL